LCDLFLVNGDAVRVSKDIVKKGVKGLPRFAAHTGYELKDKVVGRRAYYGRGHHQVLEQVALKRPWVGIRTPHPGKQLPSGWRLYIKAPHGPAFPDEKPGTVVLEGLETGVVDLDAGIGFHCCDGITDDSQ
jgi:hypothetical protein